MICAHRNPTRRATTAFVLLLMVALLATICRALSLPWYCWALVWLFAAKWTLLLILDPLPQ